MLEIFSRRARKRRKENGTGDLSANLVALTNPGGAASEAYRTLRTNLLYAFANTPPSVIVVSSPRAGEGKSTTCANLAVVLAQADNNVLVVDGDLRRPRLHKFFALQNIHGLVSVLTEQRSLEDAWHEPMPRLKVLTAGPVPFSPTELLGSRRFAEFMRRVRGSFDYVLVDGSPVGLVSDTAILAAHGDGVLLVVDAQKTRKRSVRQAVRSLEALGVAVLGTVMNNVEVPKDPHYEYGYRYGYSDGRRGE